MANTFTLIGSQTIATTGTASIVFSSIDQTYTDLILLTSLNDSGYGSINATAYVKYNSSTTNYAGKYWLAQTGASTPSAGTPTGIPYIINLPAQLAPTNNFSNGMFYIPNYSAAKYKAAISDNVMAVNTGANVYGQMASLWSDNTAISTLTITTDGSFRQYSSAYLYGIKNA